MAKVDDLPLWGVLKSKGSDEQRAMVKRLVEKAAPILDRVIETFPTYTLHNSVHSENVLRLMADLLGPQAEELRPLEVAMLILSAYYHDIGMVFREEEREKLTEEKPHWEEFLDKHAEAFLAVEEAGGVSTEIAEWYCRWRHGDRVFNYLNEIDEDFLKWGAVCIREPLGNLCRSHVQNTGEIQVNDHLKTDYLAEADLKFCAILLRVADILDFDQSRSPEEVYRYLGLNRRDHPRKTQSDVEWRKHLCSDGFKFPEGRDAPYEIGIVAGPDDPAVEYDVREFLNTIERELEKCASLVRTCSDRWRDFTLPNRIDRQNIQGNGYRYGEYRFTLEQNQVLDLLMGENLYEDPYVFVRELAQNALDTSRHREHFERSRVESDFKCEPIQVSEWTDRDGYRWVRFDDYGMGMDEGIIFDHLLKVGSSYYKSARFQADMLRAKKKEQRDFLPISRFGIGILTCFIAGDRVEVNTQRLNPDGTRATPVRLSLSGLHGFYTLQTPDLPPADMPSQNGPEKGYRKDFGTSLAVRLDPRKEEGRFDLGVQLKLYVSCPPVQVLLEGERIGGDPEELLEKPWCERTKITLTPDEMKQIEDLTLFNFSQPLEIELLPLDLTAQSPDPDLKGQMIVVAVAPSDDLARLCVFLSWFDDDWNRLESSFCVRNGKFILTLSLALRKSHLEADLSSPQPSLFSHTAKKEDPPKDFLVWRATLLRWFDSDCQLCEERDGRPEFEVQWDKEDLRATTTIDVTRLIWDCYHRITEMDNLEYDERIHWVSHNGITVPTSFNDHSLKINSNPCGADFLKSYAQGMVGLSDNLRPHVSVSRKTLLGLSWEIYSTTTLALFRALRTSGRDSAQLELTNAFSTIVESNDFLLGQILEDAFLLSPEGWAKEPIVATDNGMKSLIQIERDLELQGRISLLEYTTLGYEYQFDYQKGLTKKIALALLQSKINIGYSPHRHSIQWIASPGRPLPIEEGQKMFPPLTFVPFKNSEALRSPEAVLNQDHPFSKWLIDVAPALSEKYPGIFDILRSSLLGRTIFGRAEDARISVNQALERLSELDPELRPPREVYLKTEDFLD